MGLGVVTYVVRDIPKRIYGFLYRNCTCNMSVYSYDPIFEYLEELLSKNKVDFSIRSWTILGWPTKGLRLSPGYSSFFSWYGRTLFKVTKSINEDKNLSGVKKESLFIVKVGRSKKIFEKIVQDLTIAPDENKISFYTKSSNESWTRFMEINKRPLNTIYLPEEQKNRIIEHLKYFLENKKWFESRGIPWRTGVILEGPPGTGKTSLVKAIASELNLDLYRIDQNNKSYLDGLISSAEKKSIILIEDIDALFNFKRRVIEDEKKDEKKEVNTESFGSDNLSEVLNAIDGVSSGEGKIIIATTNDIKSLDPALIRPGRFNLKEKIDYMKMPEFTSMMNIFYGNVNLNGRIIKDKITPAIVQSFIMDNITDPSTVIDLVTDNEKIVVDINDNVLEV